MQINSTPAVFQEDSTSKIKISQLKLTLQTRADTNRGTVSEYAERMIEGDKFPPVTVFKIPAGDFLLVDGRHRVDAALKCGFVDIACDLRQGTQADALKFAVGSNATNGLQRTNADKRRSVKLALEEFGDMSDRAIAAMCRVNHHLVAEIRRPSGSSPSSSGSSPSSTPEYSNEQIEKAAKLMGIDPEYVRMAQKIKESSPELFEEVGAGKKTLPQAMREIEPDLFLPDKVGQRIPDRLIPLWERNNEVQNMLTTLSRIKRSVESARDNKDLLYAELPFTDTIARLKTAYDHTKVALAFAVCPDCNGEERAEPCKLCAGRGLLSEFRWDRCVPQKTKERIAAEVGGVE